MWIHPFYEWWVSDAVNKTLVDGFTTITKIDSAVRDCIPTVNRMLSDSGLSLLTEEQITQRVDELVSVYNGINKLSD